MRSDVTKDHSQFYKDLAITFYGANKPGAKVSQGTLDQFTKCRHNNVLLDIVTKVH